MNGSRNPLPTVSVVIPTRARGDRISLMERSVDALLGDPATKEVIVVVDAQEGVDGVELSRGDDPRVRIARSRRTASVNERRQLAAQPVRDRGVSLATGEVILALDDDVVARPGLVTGHAKWHAERDDLVVLGYMPVVSSGRGGSSQGAARLYGESYEQACALYRDDHTAVLLALWGGNFSVPRKHWLAVLDRPRVPAGYHVDRELGLHFRDNGLQGVFDPSLRADHMFRRSPRELVRDAQSSGSGQVRLEAAFPGSQPPSMAQPNPSRLARLVLASARFRPTWALLNALLVVTAFAAGVLRIGVVEYWAARVLWRLGVEHGRSAELVRSSCAPP